MPSGFNRCGSGAGCGMNLHITRHGQTDVKSDHPPGDPHLTDLGKRQAELLGHALVEQGFNGAVYSSPYFRTIETAQIVAEVADAVVWPAPPMREYVIREDQMGGFRGATLAELAAAYANVRQTSGFPYPWWTTVIESEEDIEGRVAPLVDELASGAADALLVGHGASVGGVHRHLLRRYAPERMHYGQIVGWNCCLSSFQLAADFCILRIMDVSHLPEEAVTSNAKTRDEVLAECDN